VGRDTPQSLRESPQELSPAWIAANEARRQQKETTQTESEDSFTRTRATGNFFSDEDDDDEDNNSPNEDQSLEPPTGPINLSAPVYSGNNIVSLTRPIDRTK
jgi:hypothetical protein